MAALEKKDIAGYRVEIWKTCFRVRGGPMIRIGHHMTYDLIADYIAKHYPYKATGKKSMSMNLNTLAFLVRDDVTTCNVTFSRDGDKFYTYKITRALAETLEPEDPLVVETCNGLKIAYVQEIHDEPILDPEETAITYGWAFQRVCVADLEGHKSIEETIEEKLRTRRKSSHRQQALAALGISNPEEFLKELTGPNQGD